LRTQTYDNYEVFLVDNGSNDGSVEYVNENFPWVKVIAFEKNLGFAKAYNEAIKRINTNFTALLNNDTRVDKNWLSELVESILEDYSIVAVGSKILFYENPQLINHAGAKITPTGGGFDIGLNERDSSIYNVKKEVGAVSGAAMLVRTYAFLKVGGFDEDYFAYFEDVDFCWRAWLNGFRILYIPSSKVFHKVSGSWGSFVNPVKVFLGQRNKLTSLLKNFEYKNAIKGLLLNLMESFARIMLFIMNRNIRGVMAIVKAYFIFLKEIKKNLLKRMKIQSTRKVTDSYLKSKNLIATLKESLREFLRLRSFLSS